ncbi:hypothetical protein [Negadavirga shengliensis]|uniref:Phenylacetate-CoA ligase n=1 Tax=Negadavirga shengliensis TaxID=1389218 RepID=A0ABV9T3M3_9BACT
MSKFKFYIKDLKWFLIKDNFLVNYLFYIIYKLNIFKNEPKPNKFKDFPLLNKEAIKESEKFIKAQSLFYVRSSTSGTTNAPLKVFRSVGNVIFEEYIVKSYLFNQKVPINPKIAVIRGDHLFHPDKTSEPFWLKMPFTGRLLMSSYHLSVNNSKGYLDRLGEFKPDIIMAYPSSITFLAKVAEQMGWRAEWDIKGVFTSSETFPVDDQRMVKKIFKNVYDHYGQAERVAVLQQCRLGNYHVREDYSFVEFLMFEDGCRIIGSNPKNKAMPLLRYDTGDYVEGVASGPCSCGLKSRYVSRVIGRDDDKLILPDGRVIGRLSTVFRDISGLVECQIIQEEKDSLIIKFVREKGVESGGVAKEIESELRKRVGGQVNMLFQPVDTISRSKSGKFRSVLSKIN